MFDNFGKKPLHAYKNIFTFFLCLVFFFLGAYLLIGMGESENYLYRLYFLMLLQVGPAIFILSRGQFNFIIFILLNHFMVYSVAKYNLLEHIEKKKALPEYTLIAMTEMIYCTILIIVSYYVTRFFFCRTKYYKDQFEYFFLSSRQYFWIGIFAIGQPLFAPYVSPAIVTFFIVAVGAATVLLFCSKSDNVVMNRQVKVGVLLSSYLSFLHSGSMAMMGSLGMIAGIVSIMEMKLRNFVILLFFGLTGICIQTVKLEYRILNHAGAYNNAFEQLNGLGTLLVWKFLGGEMPSELLEQPGEETEKASSENADEEGPNLRENLARGFSRVGDDSLEKVLQMTPSQVPFWDGESYEHIPYIFIPRFLWPDKPRRDLWNKFGRTYGFLSENDYSTSVGLNFLAEGYMNYGYAGLYTIACIFGMLTAFMEGLSFHFLKRYTYFTFVCFMIPFTTYGLDFGSILNGCAFILTVLLIIRYRLYSFLRRDAYSY